MTPCDRDTPKSYPIREFGFLRFIAVAFGAIANSGGSSDRVRYLKVICPFEGRSQARVKTG
ncbi:hypothetical protein POG22_22510 [Geitlerinema sp. CS-897]|nr:hypothetical protein [Geitlerinema sp. CS-897]